MDARSSDPDAPTANPNAREAIDLRGKVSDKYELRITAHYTTFNEKCQRTINALAGVKSQIVVLEELPLGRLSGSYRSSVQTDKYAAGHCRWTFYQVIYELWPKGTSHAEPSAWYWLESIGSGAKESTIVRTIVCAGPSQIRKGRTQCNYPGDDRFSRPNAISKQTEALVVNFE